MITVDRAETRVERALPNAERAETRADRALLDIERALLARTDDVRSL